MYLGIDLGTSSVKAVLLDMADRLVVEADAPVPISSPRPRWSEQDPADWWRATEAAVGQLRAAVAPGGWAAVRGIGLAGQMHGAVLLDAADQVLRPAILWNDGRAFAECKVLDQAARAIAGNLAMPGFTAPKLAWVRNHEPEIFAATRKVLLPKDWLRLRLTGEYATDMSDAAGTLWLDVAARRWSEALLEATDLTTAHMPHLVEGSEVAGRLRADVATAWGLPAGCPVAGGAGDNAAGAIGMGCVRAGDAFVSLGTSGVVFVADETFMPDPDNGVHAFCHAVPNTWHRMAVILSAAASLRWMSGVSGAASEAALLETVDVDGSGVPVFLPYLSGERTPHNDPRATGVFFGLSGSTDRAAMARAVLEGVAFALADGLSALEARGPRIEALSLIGGGARSQLWARIIASALDRKLLRHAATQAGVATGAARLARIAVGDGSILEVARRPEVTETVMPEPALADAMAPRREIYRQLYPALRPVFAAHAKEEE
jgi:xylulokinase